MKDPIPTSPQPTSEDSPENPQSRSSNTSSKIPAPLPQRVQELRNPSRGSHPNRSHSRGGVHKKPNQRTGKHPESPARDKSRRDHATYKRKFKATNDASFRRQVAIFTTVRDLPDLHKSVPRLVSSDPSTRSYILQIPSLKLFPLDERVSWDRLDTDNIRYLEAKLQLYVKLLYEHGVAYEVIPPYIYLASHGGELTLFLGGLRDTEFCEPSRRAEPQWEAREREQYIKIDHLFIPLEAASLEKDFKFFMEQAEAMKEESDALMQDVTALYGEVDITVKEADAIMRRANATMQETYASMIYAHAKLQGAASSVSEARLKKDGILFSDTNAKYFKDIAKAAKRQQRSLPVVTAAAKAEGKESATTINNMDSSESSADVMMNNGDRDS